MAESSAEPTLPVSAAAPTVAEPGPNGDDGPGEWSDEAEESSYLAEARERGEVPTVAAPAAVVADDVDPKSLPPLDDLVQRIPPEVREVLDDLFRARFTKVRRVPAHALKN